MLLKKYILQDPRKPDTYEELYEYPDCLASPTIKRDDCVLVSRVPLQIPILVLPKAYIKSIPNEGLLMDMMYADLSLLQYYFDDEKAQQKKVHYDQKLNQVQQMFAIGTMHKRSCKTMFFTGPKAVYKKSFEDNWVWLEQGILSLTNRGHYRTIDSLKLSGINEVFIGGTFECNGEVLENTQCKITVSQT